MKRIVVETNRYLDSVFLMRISRDLEQLPGVHQAIVVMGTPTNLENLRESGFDLSGNASSAQPDTLLIAIDAESESVFETARERLQRLLAGDTEEDAQTTGSRPVSLAEGLELDPEANLALISVPGEYAAREARRALRAGLHVMLFSDNVSVGDEIALKDDAIARGLLMMGPDCGTAILNGVPLGFANVCRRGSIGIVGASGTGIQEISSLVHRFGGGISQAIGTGGRDLSEAVAARMTEFGIAALATDPETKAIVVVSKTPANSVISGLLKALADTGKPSVVQFVGFDPKNAGPASLGGARFAATLEEAAILSCESVGIEVGGREPTHLPTAPANGTGKPAEGRLVGLYCGGTLCQEAWVLMSRAGVNVVSNVASDPAKNVRPEDAVEGHALWDLGDDAFTVGRPHPMIEPSLRDDRVAAAGASANIGIILVDCVLGYGAHPNPAQSLAEAARAARANARAAGRTIHVIASITGTSLDPQGAEAQHRTLEEAGVLIARSNAAAVRIAIGAIELGRGTG